MCALTGRPKGGPDRSLIQKCAYRWGLSRDNVLAVLQVVLRDALITRLELDEDA